MIGMHVASINEIGATGRVDCAEPGLLAWAGPRCTCRQERINGELYDVICAHHAFRTAHVAYPREPAGSKRDV